MKYFTRNFLVILLICLMWGNAWGDNTHGLGSDARERAAWWSDAFEGYVFGCEPVVPSSSLTIAAFACDGYVSRNQEFAFMRQAAVAITLPAVDGLHWLALFPDTFTLPTGWSAAGFGSHYRQQQSATRPTAQDGVLIFAQVTVAASVITVIDLLPSSLTGHMRSVTLDGAVCDGVTDDTLAIQRTLRIGGPMTLPPGKTCLASLTTINSGVLIDGQDTVRSLLMESNSHLHIPAGSKLRMDGVRLSSIGKDDITITGPGAIECINQVYTNEAYTGQGGVTDGNRGCVEFTGIAGDVATGFQMHQIELFGDGPCTFQGNTDANFRKGKYGTMISQAKNIRVENSYLYCFAHEALYAEGGVGGDIALGWNEDTWFSHNRIDGTNRNNINFNTGNMIRSGIIHNYVRDGAGIEVASGHIAGNTLDMLTGGTGIFSGGTVAGELTIINNKVKGGGGIFAASNSSTALQGPLTISGNRVVDADGDAGNGAISVYDLGSGSWDKINISNNVVINWAVVTNTHAYLIDTAPTSGGTFHNNMAYSPGAGFTNAACFSVHFSYDIRGNTCSPGIKEFVTFLVGGRPATKLSAYISPDQRTCCAVATVEEDIKFLAISPHAIPVSGCFVIDASGSITGTNDTKNIGFKISNAATGLTTLTSWAYTSGETGPWSLQAFLCDEGAGATMSATIRVWENTNRLVVTPALVYTVSTINTFSITGTVANTNDAVLLNLVTIQLLMGLPF